MAARNTYLLYFGGDKFCFFNSNLDFYYGLRRE